MLAAQRLFRQVLRAARREGLTNMSARDQIDAFLKAIEKNTGATGFEGLVALVLAYETGQRFRLSKSGEQYGRDAASDPGAGNRVAIECKHYRKAKLGRRELGIELKQVADEGDVDLWVLAASCAVSEQDRKALTRQAAGDGISLLFLDAGNGPAGTLLALLAHQADAVVDWAALHKVAFDLSVLRTALDDLTRDAEAILVYHQIQKVLKDTALGYEDARARAASKLLETVATKEASKARLHQLAAVRESTAHYIKRPQASRELTRLWNGGAPANPIAVLGEEGSGKTWATLDWICDGLQATTLPLVLVLSATKERVAPGQTLGDVLPTLLEKWAGLDAAFWAARLMRWRTLGEACPAILVVADGLNERHDVNWLRFFADLDEPAWHDRVQVLVTDRPMHWGRTAIAGWAEFTVGNLTEAEVLAALTARRVPVDRIPPALRSLAAAPRYLDLVALHYEEMIKADDFTRERLLYIDIRTKKQHRLGKALDDSDFFGLLRELATQARTARALSDADIRRLTKLYGEDVYDEIINSGVIQADGALGGRWKVEKQKFAFASGMLLADELKAQVQTGATSEALQDYIETWFEPNPEIDLKVAAASAALFFALLDEAYPAAARRELLRYWLHTRNWDSEVQYGIVGYVVRCPEDFLAVTEEFWTADRDSGAAQGILAEAYLTHRDHPRVSPLLIAAVKRWMGYFDPHGQPLPGQEEERRQARRQRIIDAIGDLPATGEVQAFGETLTVIIDPGLLRLARLSLLIMSAGKRGPYLQSLAPWAVRSALMGHPLEWDVALWVCRLADEDIEMPLLPIAERLLSLGAEQASSAGLMLLDCIGTRTVKVLAERYPRPVSPSRQKARREHEANPCGSFYAWTDAECESCLSSTETPAYRILTKAGHRLLRPGCNIPDVLKERSSVLLNVDHNQVKHHLGATGEDHSFKELRPFFAAHHPQLLCAFVRAVVRTLPSRNTRAQRQLAFTLQEWMPVLGPEEVAVVRTALATLASGADAWPDEITGTEKEEQTAEGFFFAALAQGISPDELAELLLNRPLRALDLLDIEIWFGPLSDAIRASVAEQLNSSETRTLMRALWLLAASPGPLDESTIERILELAGHSDWVVRAAAMRFAVLTKSADLGRRMVDLNRNFNADTPVWEIEWGARLLIEFSRHLPFDVVAARLHPVVAGHLLEARGNIDAEIIAYAHALDRQWTVIASAADPTLTPVPITFEVNGDGPKFVCDWPRFEESDRQEVRLVDPSSTWRSGCGDTDVAAAFEEMMTDQSARLNARAEARIDALLEAWKTDALSWYGRRFSADALRQIDRVRPDLTERWARKFLEVGMTRGLRVRLGSFYAQLAAMLFYRDPALADDVRVALLQRGEPIHFDDIASAFLAPDGAGDAAADRVLADAYTDDDLAAIAWHATKRGREDWIRTATRRLIKQPYLHQRAKGIALASFSDISLDNYQQLVRDADVQGTWVEKVATDLGLGVRDNAWAKDWYRRRLSSTDLEGQWAALQVVLELADERFWLWRRAIAKGVGKDLEVEDKYFEAIKNELNRRLDLSKERATQFLSLKIQRGEVVPFLH